MDWLLQKGFYLLYAFCIGGNAAQRMALHFSMVD